MKTWGEKMGQPNYQKGIAGGDVGPDNPYTLGENSKMDAIYIRILVKEMQNTASWNAIAIGTSIQMCIVISLPLQIQEKALSFILQRPMVERCI